MRYWIKYIVVVILSVLVFEGNAQERRVATYFFRGNLNPATNDFPALKVIVKKGDFIKEVVEKMGEAERKVYGFDRDAGLYFVNKEAKGVFIADSYTIEMFFRYDDAKLLLYGQLLGNELNENEGEYKHLVMSRDFDTKKVLVYVNGVKSMEFTDSEDNLLIDSESQIEFFAEEGRETTSGAVSLIKIYNFFIPEEMSEKYFKYYRKGEKYIDFDSFVEGNVLSDLFFEQSKAELLSESLPLLDQLVDFMIMNPSRKIELQGHTDNQGDFYKNIALSKERTETIKNYLVEKHIDPARIEVRGFGGARPRFSNYDNNTRKLNRRVELKVTKD